MLDTLKRQVRLWEAEGRHRALTTGLTWTWVQAHNVQDRFAIGRVPEAIAAGRFPEDPDAAVDAVLNGDLGKGVRPLQVEAELRGLIRLVAEKRPRRILEVGTARGGTLLLLCRFAAEDATIVSLDLPYGRNGGGYPEWKRQYYTAFARPGQTLHLVRGNSHDPAMRETVRDLMPGGEIDFMLIDADHSYDGVKSDYEGYGRMAAPGGVVALHDILENPGDPSIDVARFWNELAADPGLATETIVADPGQGHSGIGLVRL